VALDVLQWLGSTRLAERKDTLRPSRLVSIRYHTLLHTCSYSGGDWHADEYETPDEYARRIWEEMQVGGRMWGAALLTG